MTSGRLPDFFLLGAAKCGTTSLYTWLDQHPQICMSRPKEPRFFSGGFELGLDWYRRTYFAHWNGEQILGDAGHRNLYHAHVPARIHAVNPDARFIVLIRNPVDRALSHWWGEYRRGRERLTFDDSIRADWQRVRYGIEAVPRPELIDGKEPDRRILKALSLHRCYLDVGHYAEQIERYLELFPRERIEIFTLDALHADPCGVLRRLFAFLGIEAEIADRIDTTPLNAAEPLRVNLRRRSRQLLEQWWATRGRGSLSQRLGLLLGRPPLSEKTRVFLEAYYAPHDLKLRELLGDEFALWPECKPAGARHASGTPAPAATPISSAR